MPETWWRGPWWDIPGQILYDLDHISDNAVWQLFRRRARRVLFKPITFFGFVALGIIAGLAPTLLWLPYALGLVFVFAGSVAPAVWFGGGRGWQGSSDQMILLASTDHEFADAHRNMLASALIYTACIAMTVALGRLTVLLAVNVLGALALGNHAAFGSVDTPLLLFLPEIFLLFLLSLLGWAFYWMALRHGIARSALTLVGALALPALPGLPLAAVLYLALFVAGPFYVVRCRRAVEDGYAAILAERDDCGSP